MSQQTRMNNEVSHQIWHQIVLQTYRTVLKKTKQQTLINFVVEALNKILETNSFRYHEGQGANCYDNIICSCLNMFLLWSVMLLLWCPSKLCPWPDVEIWINAVTKTHHKSIQSSPPLLQQWNTGWSYVREWENKNILFHIFCTHWAHQ